MDTDRSQLRRFPKVPVERRAYAFLIDFVLVWLITNLTSTGVFSWIVFMICWLISRVFVVERNQGQSLGRWALDIKIIDRFNRIPTLTDLLKREGIIGGLALLAMIGLNIGFLNLFSMLILITPLIIDGVIALGDEEYYQAFHDQFAQTMIIQTRRGFSLDLRLKKIVAQIRENVRK